MIFLKGHNLGERHRDLNAKVAEAADKKTNFDQVMNQEEKSDVDKLFKIDLASKQRNIDYMLEVLKSADTLYVTRVIKCSWLFDDKYANYINTNYLTNNIFQDMSMKMQRKTLTAISIHLKNGERAIDFYTYCINVKLKEYANKFLVLTPDYYKLDLMRKPSNFNFHVGSKFLKQFIGNSIELALAYIAIKDYKNYVVYELRFLYSVSDEWYLDRLEEHENQDRNYFSPRLGIRISKDILKRHKSRVIKYPEIYLKMLNVHMLVRYLTAEDVKTAVLALLPGSDSCYWNMNFYHSYKFVLNIIPFNELFSFMKNLYNTKYGGRSFELRLEFYKLGYYELLSVEEREAWALVHIERDEELPGIENYIWYKFVSFKKAISGIRRYIHLTPDDIKRSQIVNILPETCRDQDDVTNMLNYYYQRHVNENEEYKESFINTVIERHDIYLFNNECWTSLDKLFYSLEVYSSYAREEYKIKSMIYHILQNKNLSEALEEYINYACFYNKSEIIDKLPKERNIIVAKYLIYYYAEKIKLKTENSIDLCEGDIEENNVKVNYQNHSQYIDIYVQKIHDVISCFKLELEECPEIARSYIESHIYNHNLNSRTKFIKKSEEDFVRWLKKDVQIAIQGINEIRCNTYRWSFKLTRLFRKLKVYFPIDVGAEYLEYFTRYLSNIPKGRREYRNIKMAVVAVFHLADEDFKVSFMEKYVPETPKIDHMNIDNRTLQVQKAICRLAYHSRPHLPLTSVYKYITGDYVHYFLPIFNNYYSNMPSLEKFIEVVIDAPISIQKHGLRLAFKSYSPEYLKPIILNAWKITKNVSLRKLLYETLFDRILNERKEGQEDLYEVLKLYTSELNHDDHDNVYALLVSDDFPDELKGDFIETAWTTVSKLSEKTIDLNRKLKVICHMEKYIHLVEREFPRAHIIDDHLHEMFHMKNIKLKYFPIVLEKLMEAKWNLTAKYIVSFKNKDEQLRSLDVMRYVTNHSVAMWDQVYSNTFIVRKFFSDFISTIMSKDPKIAERCAYMVPVYRYIRDTIKKTLKAEEIYLINWELTLSIICRKVIHDGINRANEDRMCDSEIISTFGKKVAEMIKKLVAKNEFHPSLYESIAYIINDIGGILCEILGTEHCSFSYYMSDSLTDFKINETHILALFILPQEPVCYCDHGLERTILKIKKFDTKEIRSLMYKKFVQSDYKVRSYI